MDGSHVEPHHRVRPGRPGCDHCYALTLAKRLKAMGKAKYQNDGDPRTTGPGFAITDASDSPRRAHAVAATRLVFVNSMSDLFHARVPLDFIRDVFDVMEETPQHTYQVLTKRPRGCADGRTAGLAEQRVDGSLRRDVSSGAPRR